MKLYLFFSILFISSCYSQESNDRNGSKIIENIAKSTVVVAYTLANSNEQIPNIGLLVEKNNLVMVTDNKIMEARQIYVMLDQENKIMCDMLAYDFTLGIALLKSQKIIKNVEPLKLNFQSEFLKNTTVSKIFSTLNNNDITNSLKDKNSWKFMTETPDSGDGSEDEILENLTKSKNNDTNPSKDAIQNSVAKQPSPSESSMYLKGLNK